MSARMIPKMNPIHSSGDVIAYLHRSRKFFTRIFGDWGCWITITSLGGL